MRASCRWSLLVFCFFPSFLFSQDLKVPTFEEVISLRGVNNPIISPDGRHILFNVTNPDWKDNRLDSEIWISKDGATPFQLTRTAKGSSFGYVWSPDSKWIAFAADRDGKTQIYAIRADGGEAQPVTAVEGNIDQFAWAPNGKQIAFTMTPKEASDEEDRKERFGAYEVDDEEYKLSGLYTIDFKPDQVEPTAVPCYEKTDSLKKLNCIHLPDPVVLIDSVEYTITGFEWSPDGSQIVFTRQPDPLRNSFFYSDISILEVASGKIRDLVSNPSFDGNPTWSPDGQFILYQSAVDNMESVYYANDRIFKIPAAGGTPVELAQNFDEDKNIVAWNPEGIFAVAFEKTKRYLYRIDPNTGAFTKVLDQPEILYSVTFSKDGKQLALIARNGNELVEIYRTSLANKKLDQITHLNADVANWKLSKSEVISWKSKDGAEIEGILHKPADYDPSKKYPLLVVIHGGPTGISLPSPIPGSLYPVLQWLDKGALVLEPNYRGSAGYGAKFRALNVRNLGVGDAWDVLSGVDYLEQRGIIDTARMGCMGWSQGGYISAFLTTTSKRFKAISVGAGISNWMTYYVNTDIHPFTRQYLKATPWEDDEIYKKTSPMTYINQASTPTLIQHGEFDQRVPIPNAYELLQGLRDNDVEAKLIVYKGFGHGINKPKERLAAAWHNWQWFNKYLWGEDVKLPFEEKE